MYSELIKMNKESYNKIAIPFSNTRSYSWVDFKNFEPFLQKDIDILEIGCGNGRLIEFVKPYYKKYIGIDFSQNLLNEAKKKYPTTQFILSDFLEFDDTKYKNCFDFIFCIAFLNHIPTVELQKKVLIKIFNMLKPNGMVFMTNWNLWNLSFKKKGVLNSAFSKIKQNFKKFNLVFSDVITEWKSNDVNVPLYYKAFTKRDLKNLCINVGFKIELNKYSNKNFWKGGNIITILKK